MHWPDTIQLCIVRYEIIWIITVFQAWNHRSDAFFPHNLDIRWGRKIILSTKRRSKSWEERHPLPFSFASMPLLWWWKCLSAVLSGPFGFRVVHHGFWFESLSSWMPDLLRLHLRTSRPRLALAALPASLQAGTGDMRPWASNSDVQIGSFGIRQLLLLFFFMLNIY